MYLCNNTVAQVEPVQIDGEDSMVLQHLWLPLMASVRYGDGTPVFENVNVKTTDEDSEDSEDSDVAGWSPKHPLELATRRSMDGGMFATRSSMRAGHDEDAWPSFTILFLSEYLRDQDIPWAAQDDLIDSNIDEFAKILASQEGVPAHVNNMHATRLSDVKLKLVRDLCKVLGFGTIARFQAFFGSETVPIIDKTLVIDALGIGGDADLKQVPKNHKEWLARPSASFDKWRRISEADVAKVRVVAARFHESEGTAVQQITFAAESEMVGTVEVDGVDLLFGTGQHRYLFQTFAGRACVPVGGGVSGSHMLGDTSVISLARCDAYVSTWLCILVKGAEMSRGDNKKKRHPSCYNNLLDCLIAPAVVSILGFCLDIFKQEPSSENELRVPFSNSSLTKELRHVGINHGELLDLAEEHPHRVAVGKALDDEQIGKDTEDHHWHQFDYYLESKRQHTLHYYDHEDKRDYCLLKPSYVKSSICCWIGDVRDVFLGKNEDKGALEFTPVTCSDKFTIHSS